MTCPGCGTNADNLYKCPDCDVNHCVDCRLPHDHDCTPTTTDETDELDQPFGVIKHSVALVIGLTAVLNTNYSSTVELGGGILGGFVLGYGLVYTVSLAVGTLRDSPTTQ